jgi:antitoxin VapB
MHEVRIAKIFKNGASQAVRLPADFRFEGKDIYAVRDDATGDVVLTKHPGTAVWKDFFDLMATIDVPEDFMQERPMNEIPAEKNLFGE